MSFLDSAGLAHFWGKIRTAMDTKQNKLTGTTGQVVGFGADGAATAVRGWSNPNLLDNWYFVGGGSHLGADRLPINQRGQTEYVSGGYNIDRWLLSGEPQATLTVGADGITINNPGPGYAFFFQRLVKLDTSAIYTFSVLADRLLYSLAKAVGNDKTTTTHFGELSVDFSASTNSAIQALVIVAPSKSATVQAAKLELGPVQTHAHKEGDTWVLNDPPPNQALELAKCQRYLVYFPKYTIFPCCFIETDKINFSINVPMAMRVNPTFQNAEKLYVDTLDNMK